LKYQIKDKDFMKKTLVVLMLFCFFKTKAQKFEGLALTPPMGWNSWNTFQTKIDEKLVRETADLMVSSGMKDAGYTYLVLDDGWMSLQRNSKTGDLIPDPIKFPSGMKALVEYVHSKGLKFGLYNCAGTKTCAGYPGTRGYEYQDARFYASLDIDYLKYDWCNTEGITAKEAYGTMSKALKAAGRPIVFSICEWGDNKPWEWAAPVGQLWRTTGDISACFDCENRHDTWSSWGIMKIVDMRKDIRKYAGPGHWNDPDMLEVGNGMSVNEDRAHFSLWAMMAAPLNAGNDIRKMSNATKEILTNKEIIAIDQDARGVQGYATTIGDSLEAWIKPLANNEVAVCFLNRAKKPQTINYDWSKNPIIDSLSNTSINFNNNIYFLRNVWKKAAAGNTGKPFTAIIPGHDVTVLRLSKSK
jgi:alpha-galactosidase